MSSSGGSILERFLIFFSADTKELDEGTKKVKNETKSLEQTMSQAATHIGGKFKELAVQLIAPIAGFYAIDKALGAIKNTIDYSDQLGKLSKETGIAVDDLDAYSQAVVKAGGDSTTFQDTIQRVSAELADFATKGRSRVAPFFQELGVKMVDSHHHARSFIDVLPDLADKFQKLSKGESFGMGERMGLDRGTILLLQQGRAAVEELIKKQKDLGVITKEGAEKAEKFNDQWIDTQHAFRTVGMQLGELLLPAFTWLLEKIEVVGEYIAKHSTLFVNVFKAMGVALATWLIPTLGTIAIESVIAFAPFYAAAIAVGLLIAAFALLKDDFDHFAKGQKSLLGEMTEKYPKAAEGIRLLSELMRALDAAVWKTLMAFDQLAHLNFSGLGTSWMKVWEQMKAGLLYLQRTFPVFGEIVQTVTAVFRRLHAEAATLFGYLEQALGKITGMFGKFANAIENTFAKAKSLLHVGAGDVTIQAAHAALATPAIYPVNQSLIPSGVMRSSSNKNTSVTTGDINIQTQATDADGISHAIGTSLDSHMRQAVNNFDDGVAG